MSWHHTHTGARVIHAMHDAHLVNALLKALSLGDGPEEVRPLAAEVVRRGIEAKAINEVLRRRVRP